MCIYDHCRVVSCHTVLGYSVLRDVVSDMVLVHAVLGDTVVGGTVGHVQCHGYSVMTLEESWMG